MPTYDYICYRCNKQREVIKTMEQFGEPVPCPNCGERMHRFWANKAPGVSYRGKGWTGAQKRG